MDLMDETCAQRLVHEVFPLEPPKLDQRTLSQKLLVAVREVVPKMMNDL